MATTSTTKPKLPQLATPVTATFPSHISGHSPLSAKPQSADPTKTPISPPLAYTDFLRFMSLNSPVIFKGSLSDESTSGSVPSTATTAPSDCSLRPEFKTELRSPMTAPPIPPSPFTQLPMSAPATGDQCFPSLKIPPSPAGSNYDSPISARSPFSARSHTKFDWETALKARKFEMKKQSAKQSRTSVRHFREVITRTVTYTPRMAPAPKGKRRKIE